MDIPRKFYTLREIGKRWEKYGIGEIDIVQMAATGNANLSVWYKGIIGINKNGVIEEYTHCEFARLPVDEALKFTLDYSNSVKTLIALNGVIFNTCRSVKENNVYHEDDLCMLPEEVERLDIFFSQKSKHVPNETKATGIKINSKTEQTLLKIIGALFHIHYNRPPFLLNGRPNAQRIEEEILSNVGEDFLEISGLREGTIRKKIPEAFESIKEYVKRQAV